MKIIFFLTIKIKIKMQSIAQFLNSLIFVSVCKNRPVLFNFFKSML